MRQVFGRIGRLMGRASVVLLLCDGLLGCGIGGQAIAGGSPGGNNPRCSAYCNARIDKGCGGDKSLCLLACNVAYSAASEGVCQQDYFTLQDCENDPSILDLGCSPPSSKLQEVCKAARDTYTACAKQRDGT